MDKKPPVTVNLSHSKPIEGPPALTELKPPHQGDGYTTATPNGAANGADHGQQDATPPILAAALALVKEMGWEVFPIRPTSRASYADLLQSWGWAEKAPWQGPDQAAIPNRPATKAACARMSPPPMFRTCPFLIIAIPS